MVFDETGTRPGGSWFHGSRFQGVWHKLESLESGSVIFECKDGPFVEHEVEGILTVHG